MAGSCTSEDESSQGHIFKGLFDISVSNKCQFSLDCAFFNM